MPTKNKADLPGSHGFGLFVEMVKGAGLIDVGELNVILKANKSDYLVSE